MRPAPAKRRNPGAPLTKSESARLDTLLEQTDDVRILRALIRDAVGIRDAMPSHRDVRDLLRRAVVYTSPSTTKSADLTAGETRTLDAALSDLSNADSVRALIRDSIGINVSIASEATTRDLLRRAVRSCDAMSLLENSQRSQAAYDR
jgi:hypothetical protein